MKSRLLLKVAMATVVLAILPLCAGAQWMESPPAIRRIDSFEDSEFDRAHRRRVLDQCELLGGIRGWTALDVVAGLPTGMMDWTAGVFSAGLDRDETISMRSPDCRSLFPRLRSCSLSDASKHPFDDLVAQILSREEKYFVRFQESAFPLAESDLMRDQKKVLFDAGRRFYFGSYGARLCGFGGDTIDVAWWNPVDFVVAPALISGYVFLFGWKTKFELLGLRGTFELESIRLILDRQEESEGGLASAAGVDIGVGDFPVKAILSLGIQDGDALIDFVGIGTSLGKARQVVLHASSAARNDE